MSHSLGTLEELPKDYIQALSGLSVAPLWPSLRAVLPHDAPNRATKPFAWRYTQIREHLMRAGDLTPIEKAERRVLVLCNPGLGLDRLIATPTIYAGLQLILPGETAEPHRHTPSAIRFVIEGDGGYTIVNDVTARDWQHRHKQWHMGKSFDSFCPMGPWVVTADACNGQDTTVRCWVNGELRQNASTRDLIFKIPKLIATISAGMTLLPGDIIATGTPVGVGIGFKPPRYLVPGDRVRIAIEGIGEIENPCEAS